MALHPDFPTDPYIILNPGIRWYPGEDVLAEKSKNQSIEERPAPSKV